MNYPDDFIDQVILGDSLEVLKEIPDNSIDTIICDPPYGLAFMGKEWDDFGTDLQKYQEWTRRWALEVLRVAKPGAILMAFGGTRTFHRLACGLEDAGWEIVDTLMWLYGSGFPKSTDISKQIDERGGVVPDFEEFRDTVKKVMKEKNISRKQLEKALGNYMLSHYLTNGSQPAIPTYRDYLIIRDFLGLGDKFDNSFAPPAKREVIGHEKNWGQPSPSTPNCANGEWNITVPATPEAKRWEGYGTALKPSYEPIILAMKPLDGTFAENALKWGVAGLNIDKARIGTENQGRFPANLLLDEISAEMLGTASRFFYVAKASRSERDAGLEEFPEQQLRDDFGIERFNTSNIKNNHPTVKPIKLMDYLVKLTKMPNPNQVYLDPFLGSGTTAIAVVLNGRHFIGIEKEQEYVEIAKKRIEYWSKEAKNEMF